MSLQDILYSYHLLAIYTPNPYQYGNFYHKMLMDTGSIVQINDSIHCEIQVSRAQEIESRRRVRGGRLYASMGKMKP